MKKSVGDLLGEGLRELTETLQSNTPVSEKCTCHQVSLELCPTAYDAALVKQTREVLNASQAIFGRFIGVSVKTVSSWEQGAT